MVADYQLHLHGDNSDMDADLTIAQHGEFNLIDVLTELSSVSGHVLIGPGDDAAQIRMRHDSYLVSTDVLVEGRHFRRDWSSAAQIGRKAAAVNLSDISAMGGVADSLTMGLAVPGALPVAWAVDMTRGFLEECGNVGAQLVGGDVADSDHIVISVTAMGQVSEPIRRHGARAGEVLAIAGVLGLSGAGHAALSRGFRSPRAAVEAHQVPSPPYAAGPQAADLGATSMIDVSDGLLRDVQLLARDSSVAIDIDSRKIGIPEAAATVGEALGVDPLRFALAGGEDYALAATFERDVELPEQWTVVGDVLTGAGVTVDSRPWEGATGHQHWR